MRGAFCSAGVPVNLDESVGEVDRLLVLHPVDIELNPVLVLAGLVIADEIVEDLLLARFGVDTGFGEAFVGLTQVLGVKARGNAAVGLSNRSEGLFMSSAMKSSASDSELGGSKTLKWVTTRTNSARQKTGSAQGASDSAIAVIFSRAA